MLDWIPPAPGFDLSSIPDTTRDAMAQNLKRPPRLTVSQWADRYRVLSAKFASEPGPWRTDRVPYLRDVMDSFGDGDVSWITFVKSARVGGSEAMNNSALYAMDSDPGPGLYVLPTEDAARDEVSGRIKTMIEDCRQVYRHVGPGKEWATNKGVKLNTMQIWMAWAAAPVTLTRRTCRFVWFDELDNCESAAGSLGNHLSLAAERPTTYGHRGKVMSVTTPSTEVAAAWTAWLASDMRKFHVPCPRCGEYQVFVFAQIKVADELKNRESADEVEADQLAWYECIHCEKIIHGDQRMWMVARGMWVPAAQTIVEKLDVNNEEQVEMAQCKYCDNQWRPELEGKKPRTRRIGYHIWSAYSPWRNWSMIIAEWFRVKDDPDRLRVFINSWLGEPWVETAEEVNLAEFKAKRVVGSSRDIVPAGVQMIVCGVDVQQDHMVYIVRGWCANRMSFLIREGIVWSFEELYNTILMPPYEQSDGTLHRVSYVAVDSGFRTAEVYDFAITSPGVYPVKGQADGRVPIWEADIEYQQPGRKQVQSVRLHHINTNFFKTLLYKYAKVLDTDVGAFGLHSETSDQYCEQFTAEHQVWETVKRKGARVKEPVWQPKTAHAPNHFLDAEVYGAAIAWHKGGMSLRQKSPKIPGTKRLPQTEAEFLGMA